MAYRSEAGDPALIADLNARIDRLPVWGVSVAAVVAVAFSWFFSFYDITSIGIALPVIAKQFHLAGAALALPISLNLFGYVVGAYVFGTVADYIGRKRTYQIILLILTVGAALTAVSWNGLSLALFRMLTGVWV